MTFWGHFSIYFIELSHTTEEFNIFANKFSAVVNALKNLQEKIHQLEVERSAAEDNLKSLASETNKYRNILHKDNERLHPTQTTVSKQNQGKSQDLCVEGSLFIHLIL